MFQRKKNVKISAKNNGKEIGLLPSQAFGNGYSAKKSSRILTKVAGDNDTWEEGFAIVNNDVNAKKGSKTADAPCIRTYFQSKASGNKVWDEPPSGASNVVYASEDVRTMAELQLKKLLEKNKAKKKGDKKFPSFPTKKKKTPETAALESKKEAIDGAVQEAIAASLNQNKPKRKSKKENDSIKMAKAISLSEHEASRARRREARKQEEIMIQEAIKLSLEEKKIENEFQNILSKNSPERATSPTNIAPAQFNCDRESDNAAIDWNGRFVNTFQTSDMARKNNNWLIAELE